MALLKLACGCARDDAYSDTIRMVATRLNATIQCAHGYQPMIRWDPRSHRQSERSITMDFQLTTAPAVAPKVDFDPTALVAALVSDRKPAVNKDGATVAATIPVTAETLKPIQYSIDRALRELGCKSAYRSVRDENKTVTGMTIWAVAL